MDPSSLPCPFCANGLPHPPSLVPAPTVRGSVMRHGGAAIETETGLVISSDNWVRVRCMHCGEEAMTPQEAVGDIEAWRLEDGTYAASCRRCILGLIDGGHVPRQRRRGHRGRPPR